MLCFVHKEKTPCKLLSYKELQNTYRTRSGTKKNTFILHLLYLYIALYQSFIFI